MFVCNSKFKDGDNYEFRYRYWDKITFYRIDHFYSEEGNIIISDLSDNFTIDFYNQILNIKGHHNNHLRSDFLTFLEQNGVKLYDKEGKHHYYDPDCYNIEPLIKKNIIKFVKIKEVLYKNMYFIYIFCEIVASDDVARW